MTYETPKLVLVDNVSALVLGGDPGIGDVVNYDFEQLPQSVTVGLD